MEKKKFQFTVCVKKNGQTGCQQQKKKKKKHEKEFFFGGGGIRNKFITANKDSSIIE